jgi:hypothetical protein
MIFRVLTCCLGLGLGLGLAGLGTAQEKKPGQPTMKAAFDQIKKLAGDWTMLDKEGKPGDAVTDSFRVTAAGSAVIETQFPGSGHEMVTVYHLDGDDLVMTHYCALGNQPRLKAERGPDLKTIMFKFAGCTNLRSDKDVHMHDMTCTVVDPNHVRMTWTACKDGKTDHSTTFDLVRKKK